MKTPNSDDKFPVGRGKSIRADNSPKGSGQTKHEQKPKMVKVNLWVTTEQDQFLNNLKSETGLDKSEHHRRAIDLYRDYLQSLKKSPEQRRSTDSQFHFLNGKDD